jgi:hypothetical protein
MVLLLFERSMESFLSSLVKAMQDKIYKLLSVTLGIHNQSQNLQNSILTMVFLRSEIFSY